MNSELKKINISLSDIKIAGELKPCRCCLSTNISMHNVDMYYCDENQSSMIMQCNECLNRVISIDPIDIINMIKLWNKHNTFNCNIHEVKCCANCKYMKNNECVIGGSIVNNVLKDVNNNRVYVCEEWRSR